MSLCVALNALYSKIKKILSHNKLNNTEKGRQVELYYLGKRGQVHIAHSENKNQRHLVAKSGNISRKDKVCAIVVHQI